MIGSVWFDRYDGATGITYSQWFKDCRSTFEVKQSHEISNMDGWLELQLQLGRFVVVFADYEWADVVNSALTVYRSPDFDQSNATRLNGEAIHAIDGCLLLAFAAVEVVSTPSERAKLWQEWVESHDETARAGKGYSHMQMANTLGLSCQQGALVDWSANWSKSSFISKIQDIKSFIASGDTYQINLTMRLKAQLVGSVFAVYEQLYKRQPTLFGCLAAVPNGWVLSFSPEWFFSKHGNAIEMKPMKGTAAFEQRDLMAHDPKTLAENVMIVDLLRNDLGKVAQIGSVTVPQPFLIETYGQQPHAIAQMISTIHAQLLPEVRFTDLLKAVFPCGSVTGAPKKRSMEIIAALEGCSRGLYTGAIGVLAHKKLLQETSLVKLTSVEKMINQSIDCNAAKADLHHVQSHNNVFRESDALFSVPIRTLLIDHDGHAQLGVGAGIVFDSDAEKEWEECWLKAQFATKADFGLGLIETGIVVINRALQDCCGWEWYDLKRHSVSVSNELLNADPRLPLWSFHLRRLQHSAKCCGIHLDHEKIWDSLQTQLNVCAPGFYRFRIEVSHSKTEVQILPFQSWPTLHRLDNFNEADRGGDDPFAHRSMPVARTKIGMASSHLPTSASAVWLRQHKTTWRSHYTAGFYEAQLNGWADAVFCDVDGWVLEGSISNLMIRKDKKWLTPPHSRGVLSGVMIQFLRQVVGWKIDEQDMTWKHIQDADEVLLCNASRGICYAEVVPL